MAAPAALATTVVVWASAFAAIREAVRALGWAHLSVLRLAVAALVLGALAAVRRVGWPARRDLPLLALCALSGMTAYQVLLNAGEVTVPAATASLLVNVAPIFTALLAASLLGERLDRDGLVRGAAGLRGRRAHRRGRRRRRAALGRRAARARRRGRAGDVLRLPEGAAAPLRQPRGHRVGDGPRRGDGAAAGARASPATCRRRPPPRCWPSASSRSAPRRWAS